MNQYTHKRIIEQNRHQFIYVENDEKRKEFIKKLEQGHKFIIGGNTPSAVIVENPLLPEIKNPNYENKGRIPLITREYLDFSLASSIFENLKQHYDIDYLNSKLNNFLMRLNKLFKIQEAKNIEHIDELTQSLKIAQNYYYQNFTQGCVDNPIGKNLGLPFKFLLIETFLYYLKKDLEYTSHIAFLIDVDKKGSIYSQQALNSLISRRNNPHLSIKIFSDPRTWQTLNGLNGEKIDYTHDFDIVELDNSHKNYIEEIKQKYLKY